MKSLFDDPSPNELAFFEKYEVIAKELLRGLGSIEGIDFKCRKATGRSSGINLTIFSFASNSDALAFEELFHFHCDWN